jgi:hypothetical protein
MAQNAPMAIVALVVKAVTPLVVVILAPARPVARHSRANPSGKYSQKQNLHCDNERNPHPTVRVSLYFSAPRLDTTLDSG